MCKFTNYFKKLNKISLKYSQCTTLLRVGKWAIVLVHCKSKSYFLKTIEIYTFIHPYLSLLSSFFFFFFFFLISCHFSKEKNNINSFILQKFQTRCSATIPSVLDPRQLQTQNPTKKKKKMALIERVMQDEQALGDGIIARLSWATAQRKFGMNVCTHKQSPTA